MKNFIKKIFTWFYQNVVNKLKLDDVLHAYISTILTNVFFLSFGMCMNVWIAFSLAILLTLLIGLIKEEVIDKRIRGGEADIRDFIADCVGIIVGTLINGYIILYTNIIF